MNFLEEMTNLDTISIRTLFGPTTDRTSITSLPGDRYDIKSLCFETFNKMWLLEVVGNLKREISS